MTSIVKAEANDRDTGKVTMTSIVKAEANAIMKAKVKARENAII